MPNIDTITTAAWRLLSQDTALAGMCAVYKGGRRPGGATGPVVTVEARGLERGGGDGIWMCDVTATVYAPLLANRGVDFGTMTPIIDRIRAVLSNAELALTGAHALPLIDGGGEGYTWDSDHNREAAHGWTFGLIFIDFS